MEFALQCHKHIGRFIHDKHMHLVRLQAESYDKRTK